MFLSETISNSLSWRKSWVTRSITCPIIKIANSEYKVMAQSLNTMAPNTTITPSTIIISLPNGFPVHLPSIMTITSVPPLAALALNSMPTPKPITGPPFRAESKTSSSRAGLLCVVQFNPSIKPEFRIKPVNVLAPKCGPRTMMPVSSKGILNMMAICRTNVPKVWCSIIELP